MSDVPSQNKFSVHQSITEKIVAAIEAGLGNKTFRAPWHAPNGPMALPMNAATHALYRGVNVVSLWMGAQARGFDSSYWASYRQWQSLNAQVRKGERGSMVVFYKRIETRACEDEDHDRTGKLAFFARASTVFNAEQVDGFVDDSPEPLALFQRVAEAEALVANVGAMVRHGGSHACYRPREDLIEMPDHFCFVSSATSTREENYYAVLLHELTHWTGAPHRLNREFGKRFGDNAYAMEELVAELGAAFLCAALGISNEPRQDHAIYIASWLKMLRSDSKAIFKAAKEAQVASDELIYRAVQVDRVSANDRWYPSLASIGD